MATQALQSLLHPTTGEHICLTPIGGHCVCKGSILNPTADITAQQAFDNMYVTSKHIAATLGVSRQAVVQAVQRGTLPAADVIVSDDKLHLWLRKDVEPHVDAWKQAIDLRRGVQITIPLVKKGEE
jgi:hypothetical protein